MCYDLKTLYNSFMHDDACIEMCFTLKYVNSTKQFNGLVEKKYVEMN